MKKVIQNITLLAIAPLLAGCGGGGGALAALGLGSLFGGGSASLLSSGSLALLEVGGGAGIPTVVNPEPASMLLMGTGIAAMAYFKKKK